jgi:hypothetical protein
MKNGKQKIPNIDRDIAEYGTFDQKNRQTVDFL